MLLNLVKKNRSLRRFLPGYTPDDVTLSALVEFARFSATGKNRQLLRFRLINKPDEVAVAYASIKGWKMMLPGWNGQKEEERPSAYILIVNDDEQGKRMPADVGIAAQSITLGAAECGLACCMLLSYNGPELVRALALPGRYSPQMLIAIGKPGEEVVLEDMPGSGNTAYWEDDDGVHHVPKHALDTLIIS